MKIKLLMRGFLVTTGSFILAMSNLPLPEGSTNQLGYKNEQTFHNGVKRDVVTKDGEWLYTFITFPDGRKYKIIPPKNMLRN